jgi:hypothetical protein
MKRQILAKRLKIRDNQRICEGTCSPSQPVNWNCRQAANLSQSKSKEKVKIGCMMVWGWLKPESLDLCLWMEGAFGVFHCKLGQLSTWIWVSCSSSLAASLSRNFPGPDQGTYVADESSR